MPGQLVMAASGFFGKLSSHGDFVSRRLSPALLRQWDRWLQICIQTSQQQLAADWLPAYLSSPVWRCALAPGVLDEQRWAGVLMPSTDRVGRHFPLLITCASGASASHCWSRCQTWYEQAQALALSSAQQSFQFEAFDAALSVCVMWSEGDLLTPATPMPALIVVSANTLRAGYTLWWSTQDTPALLLCRGLPDPATFGAMLDGSWRRAGWCSKNAAVLS